MNIYSFCVGRVSCRRGGGRGGTGAGGSVCGEAHGAWMQRLCGWSGVERAGVGAEVGGRGLGSSPRRYETVMSTLKMQQSSAEHYTSAAASALDR